MKELNIFYYATIWSFIIGETVKSFV